MRCDMCHEHWAVQELCPDCWVDLIGMLVEQDWKCADCGESLKVKTTELAEGTMILMVSCSHCRTVYKPA